MSLPFKLLTVHDVVDLLDIPERMVYRLIASRLISFYRIGGRLRFAEDEMLTYLAEEKSKPEGERFYVAPYKSHPK